jgi:hypothetical protein
LQNDDYSLRPTFKDFLKVLKYSKVRALALPAQTERLARLVMADRVFGQIIDTLIARRIYHRTAIAVVLPDSDGSSAKPQGRFFLHAPGLAARGSDAAKVFKFDDAAAALAQIVGVQLSQNDTQGRMIFKGSGLEAEPLTPPNASVADVKTEKDDEASASPSASADASPVSVSPAKQLVSKFRLIVLPRAAGCQPFEWIASSPYFGLTSSQPIVEEPHPRGRIIRVFPCGLRDQVIELSWFQSHSGDDGQRLMAEQVNQWLGGTFRIDVAQKSAEDEDSPVFLVGPRAMRFDSLPLRLRTFETKEISNLFDLSKNAHADRETFARILNLSSQLRNDRMSARTLVYFFREPVLR